MVRTRPRFQRILEAFREELELVQVTHDSFGLDCCTFESLGGTVPATFPYSARLIAGTRAWGGARSGVMNRVGSTRPFVRTSCNFPPICSPVNEARHVTELVEQSATRAGLPPHDGVVPRGSGNGNSRRGTARPFWRSPSSTNIVVIHRWQARRRPP